MAASREVTDATKRKIAIVWVEPEDVLKWLSTHIEMKLQAAISRTRSELERDDS